IVHVWDAQSGRPIRTFGKRFKIEARGQPWNAWIDDDKATCKLDVSQEAQLVAIAALDGRVHLWDLSTGKELRSFKLNEKQINRITVTADGKRLFMRGREATLQVWDVAKGESSGTFEPFEPRKGS